MPARNLARRLPVVQREADGNALLKVYVTNEDRPAERWGTRTRQRKRFDMYVGVGRRLRSGDCTRSRRVRVHLVERLVVGQGWEGERVLTYSGALRLGLRLGLLTRRL